MIYDPSYVAGKKRIATGFEVPDGFIPKSPNVGTQTTGQTMKFVEPNKQEPPFVSVMTPYVAGQLAKNINSTTFVSDLERIRGMTDIKGTPMISNIYIIMN